MNPDKNNRSIYLCGFMGCGKSTVGRILSAGLNKKLVDLDTYIENKEQMKIPEMFEKFGEEYFREKESLALKELEASGAVVATGGGALLSDKNGQIAKNSGLVIFIDTPFAYCYNRIKGDKNRPIAYNSTKQQLKERFDYRRPLYIKNSHYSVSGQGSPRAIAQRIIQLYNKNLCPHT
ncbi:MAG: shikimate kinase [Oscillospiraceae bacterium]